MRLALPLDRRDAGLLPGVAVLILFGIWASDGGAFRATAWYPGGLLLLGLVVASIAGLGARLSIPLRASVPLAFLAAYTAWSYLSMTWAGVSATAWDGANRTAVYLAAFAVIAGFTWRTTAVTTWLTLFIVTVVVVASVDFVGTLRAVDPNTHFIYGRYAGPIEYPNGTVCLYFMACWPALLLAAQRGLPPVLRAFAAASATYLVELALLAQSRGGTLGLIFTAGVFVLIVPMRVRSVFVAGVVALGVFAAHRPLLDVYQVVSGHGDTQAAVERASRAILWSCIAVLIVSAFLALIDRRWSVSEVRAKRIRLIVGSALAVIALALAGAAAAATHPVARARHAWHQFTAIPQPYGVGLGNPTSHFAANPLSGNRYDVWRVAWRQFERDPVAGAGADNFAVDYLRERRSEEEPQYPFSLELRALGQTGIVGAALLAAFFVAATIGLVRAASGPMARVAVTGCALVATQWFAHASVDIMWEIPAVAAPAFAAIALGLRAADPRAATAVDRSAPTRRLAVAFGTGAILLALLMGASFVFPWLAAAEVRAAEGIWRDAPARANARLARAHALNPLSDDADIVRGVIAGRRRDWPAMRAAMRRARDRNPLNWYSWFELAVVNAYTGHAREARAQLRQAKRLNPREWTIGFVRYRLGIRKPLAPIALDRIFKIRYVARTAPAAPLKP